MGHPTRPRPPPGPEPGEGKWVSARQTAGGLRCPLTPSGVGHGCAAGVRADSLGAPPSRLFAPWTSAGGDPAWGPLSVDGRLPTGGPSLLSRGRSRGTPLCWALGRWAATSAPPRSRGGHFASRDARVPAPLVPPQPQQSRESPGEGCRAGRSMGGPEKPTLPRGQASVRPRLCRSLDGLPQRQDPSPS